jgi:hypothetical protein
MNNAEEQAYIEGSRAVWLELLRLCHQNLGQNGRSEDDWFIERTETVASLRSLCREFGDNEWDDGLNLAEIIDNHLGGHLRAPGAEVKAEGDVKQTIRLAVDILNQSRHAFRSKQIQQVREMLEKLL